MCPFHIKMFSLYIFLHGIKLAHVLNYAIVFNNYNNTFRKYC